MGCVLGTRATSDRRSKSNLRREAITTSGTNTQRVEYVASDDIKDGVEKRIRQISSDVRVSNGRRTTKLEYSLNTAPAWPSWLSDVAGDAISDWTPRRANSFEKLDKVNFKTTPLNRINCSCILIYFGNLVKMSAFTDFGSRERITMIQTVSKTEIR